MALQPTVKIISPSEGDQFYVGEILRLKGEAFYANGTAVDDSSLRWEVIKHHDDHFHPFLDPAFGNDFDLFAAPRPENYHASLNSYLEISLHVTDENGLFATTSQVVHPSLVTVNVTSNLPGSTIRVEDEPITMPEEIWGWEKQQMRLKAENVPPFVFESWSDGLRDPERLTTLNLDNLSLQAKFCVDDGGRCERGTQTCCLGECNREGICTVPVKLPPLYLETRSLPPAMAISETLPPTFAIVNSNQPLPSLKRSAGGTAMLSITLVLIVFVIASFLYLWLFREHILRWNSPLGSPETISESQEDDTVSKDCGQEAFVNSVTSSSSGEGIASVV